MGRFCKTNQLVSRRAQERLKPARPTNFIWSILVSRIISFQSTSLRKAQTYQIDQLLKFIKNKEEKQKHNKDDLTSWTVAVVRLSSCCSRIKRRCNNTLERTSCYIYLSLSLFLSFFFTYHFEVVDQPNPNCAFFSKAQPSSLFVARKG